MAEDSKFPNLGGNGFIWILLVAAGTYLVAQQQVSLQGSRPASTERSIAERVGEQHVDARLWQDPFATVADYLAKSPSLKRENCGGDNGRSKGIETYCRQPLKPPATIQASGKPAPEVLPDLTLVVSASGSSYSEDQEARRRKRYAVLAGLNAEGFVPADSQHIGFFWPGAGACWWHGHRMAAHGRCAAGKAAVSGSAPIDLSAAPPPSVTLPKIVPYEWFRPDPERLREPARVKESAPEAKKGYRVLLLWLDEDAGRERARYAGPGSIATVCQTFVSLPSGQGDPT